MMRRISTIAVVFALIVMIMLAAVPVFADPAVVPTGISKYQFKVGSDMYVVRSLGTSKPQQFFKTLPDGTLQSTAVTFVPAGKTTPVTVTPDNAPQFFASKYPNSDVQFSYIKTGSTTAEPVQSLKTSEFQYVNGAFAVQDKSTGVFSSLATPRAVASTAATTPSPAAATAASSATAPVASAPLTSVPNLATTGQIYEFKFTDSTDGTRTVVNKYVLVSNNGKKEIVDSEGKSVYYNAGDMMNIGDGMTTPVSTQVTPENFKDFAAKTQAQNPLQITPYDASQNPLASVNTVGSRLAYDAASGDFKIVRNGVESAIVPAGSVAGSLIVAPAPSGAPPNPAVTTATGGIVVAASTTPIVGGSAAVSGAIDAALGLVVRPATSGPALTANSLTILQDGNGKKTGVKIAEAYDPLDENQKSLLIVSDDKGQLVGQYRSYGANGREFEQDRRDLDTTQLNALKTVLGQSAETIVSYVKIDNGKIIVGDYNIAVGSDHSTVEIKRKDGATITSIPKDSAYPFDAYVLKESVTINGQSVDKRTVYFSDAPNTRLVEQFDTASTKTMRMYVGTGANAKTVEIEVDSANYADTFYNVINEKDLFILAASENVNTIDLKGANADFVNDIPYWEDVDATATDLGALTIGTHTFVRTDYGSYVSVQKVGRDAFISRITTVDGKQGIERVYGLSGYTEAQTQVIASKLSSGSLQSVISSTDGLGNPIVDAGKSVNLRTSFVGNDGTTVIRTFNYDSGTLQSTGSTQIITTNKITYKDKDDKILFEVEKGKSGYLSTQTLVKNPDTGKTYPISVFGNIQCPEPCSAADKAWVDKVQKDYDQGKKDFLNVKTDLDRERYQDAKANAVGVDAWPLGGGWKFYDIKLVSNYAQGYSGYSDLFMSKEDLAKWRYKIDEGFKNFEPAGWVENICMQKIRKAPQKVAYVKLPDKSISPAASVSGECGPPISDPFSGSTQRLLKITAFVHNPQGVPRETPLEFNILLKGGPEGTIPLLKESIQVPFGETYSLIGSDAFVKYTSNVYTEVCVVFNEPPPFLDGKESICNRIACVDGEPMTLPAGAPIPSTQEPVEDDGSPYNPRI